MSNQVVRVSQPKAQADKKAAVKTLPLRTGVQAGGHPMCYYYCKNAGKSDEECRRQCE